MSDEAKVQGVTYKSADGEYFDQRKLVRSGTYLGLWGLGIAAVISGDFSGWNFGLLEAGWGGMFIATIIITIMYFGMVLALVKCLQHFHIRVVHTRLRARRWVQSAVLSPV